MRNLDIRDMAIELLCIDREFYQHMDYNLYKNGKKMNDYDFYTFEQMWGNTSGGFEGVGGCAMTNQRTYVFIPKNPTDDKDFCFVYFGMRFAYAVPYSEKFEKDVHKQDVAGKSSYRKYYKIEE